MTAIPDLMDDSDAGMLRAQLVDTVMARVGLETGPVTAALAAVPRHAFAPAGTPLPAAYADDVVVTKRDPTGKALSSLSAPWLVATMLHQLRVEPGHRVLEIGPGGYNAALLSELVGPTGEVTTVDIDPDVTDRARACLTAAGYDAVRVLCADGVLGAAEHGPFDRIIVTVNCWDIPPAWTDQLTPDGVLVLPLSMRGITRSLSLVRDGDHLTATSAVLCGFVAMQGAGAHHEQRLPLRGQEVGLRLDEGEDLDITALAGVFDMPRVDTWSGVMTPPMMPFDTLHLWLATANTDGFGLLAVDKNHDTGLLDPQNRVCCPAVVRDGSVAYLATRELDASTYEFGAHGFGPGAAELTALLNSQIMVWDREHRHGPGPRITVHLAGSMPRTAPGEMVIDKRHVRVVLAWPAPGASQA